MHAGDVMEVFKCNGTEEADAGDIMSQCRFSQVYFQNTAPSKFHQQYKLLSLHSLMPLQY